MVFLNTSGTKISIMKKFIFILSVCCISMSLFQSCTSNSDDIFKDPEQLKEIIDVEKLILYINNLNPSDIETSTISVPIEIINNNLLNLNLEPISNAELYKKKYSHMLFNETNLNSFISEKSDLKYEILSITAYINKDENIEGAALHIFDKKESNFYIYNFLISKNNTLTIIDGFPKKINHIFFDDIYYIGNTYFPLSNIKASSILNYKRQINYNYNDLRISYKYKSFVENKNSSVSSNTNIIHKVSGCSIATHMCMTGSGACTTAGCRVMDECIVDDDEDKFALHNLEDEYSLYKNFLPNSYLYTFRDQLLNYELGSEYVGLYYELSPHFNNSIDFNVLYKMYQMSSKVSTAIEYFLINDDSQVIIDEELKVMITELLTESSNNSESNEYKEIINSLIQDLDTYAGLKSETLISLLQ